MSGKRYEVELPEEVVEGFGWQERDVASRMREMAVMELLRRDQISEAEAAEHLGLRRRELLHVMGQYHVPAIRMTHDELQHELHQEIRHG